MSIARGHRPVGTYLAIWAASALLCLGIDFFYFPGHPVFPDENRFLASAAHWLSNGTFISNGGRAWEMPLPSLMFAGLRRLAGGGESAGLLAIRVTQAILVIGQSWLAGQIARMAFADRRAALLATIATAFYPFLLFYQGLALSETLFDLLLLASIAALYAWHKDGHQIGGRLAGAMVLAALATYTKATLTLVPPLLPSAMVWATGQGVRKTLVTLAVASAVYGACLTPWWVRNYGLFDAFVPFTTSSASNLYLGNNPANLGGGNDWNKDAEPEVVARIEAMPGELDRQAAYGQAAKQFIRDHPAAFLRLCVLKLGRFWNVIPNAEGYNSGSQAVIAAVSFGPVLLFALVGLVVNRRHWRSLLPIYLLIAYFTALHTVTIASLRYRLPLEPLLIVLAAGAASALSERRARS